MFSIPPDPDSLSPFLTDHPEVDLVFIDMVPSQDRGRIMTLLKNDFPLLTLIAASYPAGQDGDRDEPQPDFLLPHPVQLSQVQELINSLSRIRL